MKSFDQINTEIDQLVQSLYYSEDYEMGWAIYNYQEELHQKDQALFREVITRRLLTDPSAVNIALCARLNIPALAPILVALLSRETTSSQRSRAIMFALRHYMGQKVFQAVERFVDSEQEIEALLLLARIDFKKFYPYFLRAMKKEHLLDICLHILHGRKKAIGLPKLITELKQWALSNPTWFKERMKKVLASQPEKYNPFRSDEITALQEALHSM